MFEVAGKYDNAKIFTDVVEPEAISQVIQLINQPYAHDQTIRMMPDIHAGAGCTIGTTMTISDKICPNLVGVDIGCGMLTVKLSKESVLDFERLDTALHGYNGTEPIVPSGMSIRTQQHHLTKNIKLEDLICKNNADLVRAYLSLGSLGGGNHFIELDKNDDTGDVYLVIHTGSRHLGFDICTHYQLLAARLHSGPPEDVRKELIETLKAQGKQSEIFDALKKLKEDYPTVPKELAWCEGKLFDDYIHDMRIAQQFAHLNRKAIADTICKYMNWVPVEEFETIHNYIDTEYMILRKGAVSAREGEKLLIPINMRDGSLICTGKGNPDWNYSAPHGAGRLMSRSKAKETIPLEEFEQAMGGIYTTSVNLSTLDESPMAYKRIEDIVNNIEPTVYINSAIRPIYNFKASE